MEGLAPENNAAWLVALPRDQAGALPEGRAQPIDGGKRFLRVEGNRVQLLPSGRPLELPFHVSDATASPDAEWVIVRGATHAMENIPFTLFNLATGARAEAQPARVTNSARWSPNGSVVALWFHEGRQVDLLSLNGQSETLHAPAPIVSLAFSPDGSVVAFGCADGVIRRFDVATGKALPELIHRANRSGSERALRALAYSHDGRTLASGNGEGTIVLWDVTDD
ncbi:MAG: hypothetical protein JNK04_26405 [Myxococcales bacterium]|nr:hypothetical protein [Myxococcales bacterium]